MKLPFSLTLVLALLGLPSCLHAQTIQYVQIGSSNTYTSNWDFEFRPEGTMLIKGDYGTGTFPSGVGTGPRILWFPKLSAFRAGYFLGTDFSESSYGASSVALNYKTKASGANSLATGSLTVASGTTSSAFGTGTEASGSYATAFGNSTHAVGTSSTAFGSGTYANLNYSTAFGYVTYANGNYSASWGYNTTADAQCSVAFGKFNVGGGNPTGWSGGEPLFEIGNGTDVDHKSDALLLDKSGNLTVNTVRIKAVPAAGDIPMFGN